MAERNIKPVTQISRHLPLQIGGSQLRNRRRTEPYSEAADITDETEEKDHLTHSSPEADPGTYMATEVQEVAPEPETTYNEAEESGYREGYEQGIAAGYDAGYDQGRKEAHEEVDSERQAERNQLSDVLEVLHHPLTHIREEIADSVIEGAIDLARRLVDESLAIDSSLIRDTLLHILDEAAVHNGPGTRLQLRIAPDYHEITERLIDNRRASDLPVDLIDDDNLGRGDIQATLLHDNGDPANQVEWDARLETRWQTIRQALQNPQPEMHSDAE